MQYAAEHALIRFGLGRKGAEPLPASPRDWLLAQLEAPDAFPTANLGSTDSGLQLIAQKGAPGGTAEQKDAALKQRNLAFHDVLQADSDAHLGYALQTDAPFRERLVWFWTNHFTVSVLRHEVTVLAGPFVREAIRPHVTGTFADMLLAVMRHPAMLIYLDNIASIGPSSDAGRNGKHGLNENLARESLELHTVTPASGYTQADVTSYASILTGWSIGRPPDPLGFKFRPHAHDPGPKTLMGRNFAGGEQGGLDVLHYLGTHPASYHAIAAALARHFIADTPPADAVARIAARLTATGGNLGAAATATVAEPAAWQPLQKLRQPLDYVVAVMRALDLPQDNRPDLKNVVAVLGQPLWRAPLPNGWSDNARDWAAPETLLRRADWAFNVSLRAAQADPAATAQQAMGGLLQPATLAAIQHAGSRRDALTLFLSSPEFMRR